MAATHPDRYVGKTAWESLGILMDNPPTGSGAAFRQYMGAVKVLDHIVKQFGMDEKADRWVAMPDKALLNNLHVVSINPSDIVAWRMEFGRMDG